jgi:hypothetical protein
MTLLNPQLASGELSGPGALKSYNLECMDADEPRNSQTAGSDQAAWKIANRSPGGESFATSYVILCICLRPLCESPVTNSHTERDQALEELKVYGRNPVDADPIFTREVSCAEPVEGVII